LNPAFTPVIVDADEVHFTTGPWSGPAFELVDEDRDGNLEELVATLDGRTSVEELLDSFDAADREEIKNILLTLQQKSIVRDASEPVDEWRTRIGGYLTLRDTDSDPIDRVQRATLLVVGAGAVGRAVVTDALGAGVGAVRYVDLLGSDDLNLFHCDRFVRVDDVCLTEEVDIADFVILAVDRPYPMIASDINDATHAGSTPWTVGVLNGLDGQIGPTVYPGETACYECFRTRAHAATAAGVGYREFEVTAERTGALLPSFAHVIAGLVVVDVVTQLAGGFGKTTGSIIDFDFADFAVQVDDVLRMPRCETCGKSSDRLDSPRHITLERLVKRWGEEE
jgi:bacteriocin biosynthesis cyclodehydratase domain-containing protein